MRILTALFATATVVGCSTISEKWDRFLEGTEPDRPTPTVPPAPLGEGEVLPGPKVVVLSFPGLPAELIERGMRDDWLPAMRILRTHGSYARLDDGAASRSAADAVLLTAAPAGREAPFALRSAPMSEASGRTVSVAAPAGGRPTLAGVAARQGLRARVLRSSYAVAPAGASSLFGGAWPDLGHGVPYTFALESDGSRGRTTTSGGVQLDVQSTTGDRNGDVFFIDVDGPPTGAGDASSTRLRILASRDRSRAAVISSEDRIDLIAGEWSRPLGMRFELVDGVSVRGRARLYLRPTGSAKLELFVEPADFDPRRPPSWQPLSSPLEFASEVASRVGELPRFSSALPRAALTDGVLSVRDAASAIETAFDVERAMFERELLGGDFELLYQTFTLGDETTELTVDGDDQEVVFFGLRVPRELLIEASAARLDRLLQSALLVADSGKLGPDVTVLVCAGTDSGWYAVNRRGVAPAASTLASIAELPAAWLDLPRPDGGVVRVASEGELMARLAEEELRRTAREDADIPSEFELRGR